MSIWLAASLPAASKTSKRVAKAVSYRLRSFWLSSEVPQIPLGRSEPRQETRKERTMSKLKRILLAAVFLLFPSILSAQQPVVKGRITDPAGLPIQNASVRLENSATGVNLSVSTNEEGNYVFPPAQPGSYLIRIIAPGFD